MNNREIDKISFENWCYFESPRAIVSKMKILRQFQRCINPMKTSTNPIQTASAVTSSHHPSSSTNELPPPHTWWWHPWTKRTTTPPSSGKHFQRMSTSRTFTSTSWPWNWNVRPCPPSDLWQRLSLICIIFWVNTFSSLARVEMHCYAELCFLSVGWWRWCSSHFSCDFGRVFRQRLNSWGQCISSV